MAVPTIRVRAQNSATRNPTGDYVLLWTTAFRRASHNFALDRALEHCRELGRPLLVLEGLRVDYEWASDRFHQFVIEGMRDQAATYEAADVTYLPYVEPEKGAGRGLLEALAAHACCVVTDDFPSFFLPKMVAAAGDKLEVLLEAVDSNGLYPIHATDRVFTRAYSFRRHLQKEILPHLRELPNATPLADYDLGRAKVDRGIAERWPSAVDAELATLPIDHSVKPAIMKGGANAARKQLTEFFEERFSRYGDDRNHPDHDASSGLSPWLHFGHLSTHEVWRELIANEGWSERDVGRVNGSRNGFWNMSETAESFLDELLTWREVGFNMCAHVSNYDRLESLPDWAKITIAEHANDERPTTYTLEELEHARTHDLIWNAAQRQLVQDGRMHNYLRMLWGKLIYQWSANAEDALKTMIHLNNKFAVDGRNPNSYSGIMWVLGRYDRAWGPVRPIFGKLRYMTSDSTKRKLKMKRYLEQYGDGPSQLSF